MKFNAEKLKSGNYRVRATIGGVRRSFTASTAKEAKALAMQAASEYALNIKPDEDRARNPQTVGDMLDAYIRSRSNVLSVSTIRGYDVIKRNRFKALQQMRYADIRNADWQLFVNAEAGNISAKTLKNAFALVRSAVEYCGGSVPPVRLPQVVPHEGAFLTHEEIKIFLKAIEGDAVELPALLALHSLRRSEICALTWRQIDLKNNVINVAGAWLADTDNNYVRQEQNKSKTSRRTVPIMIPRLRVLLEEKAPYASPDDRVYTSSPDTIRNGIKRICKNNKDLPDNITTHSLRHSFASLAYYLGLNELTTMQLGGWSDYGTMRKIYTHIAQDDINKSVDNIKKFYDDLPD